MTVSVRRQRRPPAGASLACSSRCSRCWRWAPVLRRRTRRGRPAVWQFLTSYPSRGPRAPASWRRWRQLFLIALTALIAIPLGVGAAIYLEEDAHAAGCRG